MEQVFFPVVENIIFICHGLRSFRLSYHYTLVRIMLCVGGIELSMQNHFFFHLRSIFLLGRFRNRYPRATCQEGSSDGTTIASNTRLNIINSNAIDFISSLLQRRRFKI